MLYQGKNLFCKKIENNFMEIQFIATDDSVNKFNRLTCMEFREVLDAIQKVTDCKGLMITSGKESFIVGADVTEFLGIFDAAEGRLGHWLKEANKMFSDLEDLPFPTVSAINGYALGGGLELALSTDYRIMATPARIGLPEVKLGIYPGFGGTVRLSRLVGADNAIEWIATGDEQKSDNALQVGVVDAVVELNQLRAASIHLLKRASEGSLNWQQRRTQKKSPLNLNEIESAMVFEGAKAFVAGKAGPHYPAPVEAIKVMQKGASLERDEAIAVESEGFLRMSKTSTARNLIGLFLGDQYLKREAKHYQKQATPVKTAAVLGAGIMGGGIAYQSASKGIPIVMKDIQEKALDLGLREAAGLLSKLVERKKMDPAKMANVLNQIRATLSYEELKNVDIVVEAVVENANVKKQVLADLEKLLPENTIIASNTSTISITSLADGLKNPDRFCGMHFFNPVYKMPLVEVIRGQHSSERAIATTVSYAMAMGKTPIVVNDCPGFLVNRILMPYFAGFMGLLRDGADYQKIDKVMEKFGWPMGPAFLLDVVGIDTAHHASEVMSLAFGDRLKSESKTALDVLYENRRFGQKNGQGFYLHMVDKKGKPQKQIDSQVASLLAPVVQVTGQDFTDEEIINRMMIPMVIEGARCLDDRIVGTPTEVDMGLILGIGFPPFRGGACRYADEMGLEAFCKKAEKYASLGKLYHPTASMLALAQAGKGFYSNESK